MAMEFKISAKEMSALVRDSLDRTNEVIAAAEEVDLNYTCYGFDRKKLEASLDRLKIAVEEYNEKRSL